MLKRPSSLFRLLASTFGLLTVFVFLSIVISTGIIVKIQQSVGLLVGRTFPTINLVNDIKIQNNYLSNLLPALTFVEDEESLYSSVSHLLRANNRLLESVRNLPEDYELEFGLNNHVSPKKINALIESQFELLKNKIVIKSQLKDSEVNILKLIDTVSNEIALKIIDVDYLSGINGVGIDQAQYYLIQDLFLLSAEVKSLSLLVSRASLSPRKDVVSSSQQQFGDSLRSASATVASLSNLEYRLSFSKSLGLLYDKHNSGDSFFDISAKLIDIDESVILNNSRIYENLEFINNQLDGMFEYTNKLNEESVSKLGREASIALYLFIVMVLFVLGMLAFVFLRVIPQKIISPLKGLTKAIVDLGGGSTSYRKFDTSNIELKKIDEALGVFVNNAKRLRLRESELLEKNALLDRSNENLKAFTRVSSHDLKSPLRGIRVLCYIVNENIEKNELALAHTNLNRIDQRTARLESLLDSLLDYTKIDSYVESIRTVKIHELACSQHEILHKSVNFPLKIESDSDTIDVFETVFTLVVRNLLDNAIKHHDCETGVILLKVSNHADGTLELSVEDDGPGIHKDYQERILNPFETLKPKDEVEGSGMGLAIINKLVTNINGSFRVESPILNQRGARFVVVMPTTHISANKALSDGG